ncbi:unnamed protein product [Brugia pahangi]|uniref:Uncharacterized protein n=1 Tax=Brugia pahangi TaxID=6280 RepID=A0A0N4T5C9_BRUPA|nr:unnamed protein product [Brugia pahangi]
MKSLLIEDKILCFALLYRKNFPDFVITQLTLQTVIGWNHGYHGLIKVNDVQRRFYQLIINK